MKLSDFKNERAIEVVANLLPLIGRIASNKANAEARKDGTMAFASALLKNNSREAFEILAILNDVPVEDFTCTPMTIFKDLMEMLNDPEMMQLFGLQSQKTEIVSSGSVSENAG